MRIAANHNNKAVCCLSIERLQPRWDWIKSQFPRNPAWKSLHNHHHYPAKIPGPFHSSGTAFSASCISDRRSGRRRGPVPEVSQLLVVIHSPVAASAAWSLPTTRHSRQLQPPRISDARNFTSAIGALKGVNPFAFLLLLPIPGAARMTTVAQHQHDATKRNDDTTHDDKQIVSCASRTGVRSFSLALPELS